MKRKTKCRALYAQAYNCSVEIEKNDFSSRKTGYPADAGYPAGGIPDKTSGAGFPAHPCYSFFTRI